MGTCIIQLFQFAVGFAILLVIISAILSWLIAFDVINLRNPRVGQIVRGLDALTEPMLRPIRKLLPTLGGIDLSPIIFIAVMQFFVLPAGTWLLRLILPPALG